MQRILLFIILLGLILHLFDDISLLSSKAQAHDTHEARLAVEKAWARDTGGRTQAAAVYLHLTNIDHHAVTITGVSSLQAAKAGLHQSVSQDHVIRMLPVASLTIEPDAVFEFTPGGYHIMLTGLTAPLKEGDVFPISLLFSDGEPAEIFVTVTGPQGF